MEKYAVLILRVIFDQPWKSVTVYYWILSKDLKDLFFVLIAYDSCVDIKQ